MHRSLPARIGLSCGLAALLLAGGAAQAEEGVAIKNLMGTIGLLPQDKDPIRYRERAPLVIPPKAELPQPSASYASSNPQWPNDPDVSAKRRRSDEGRNPVTWSETRRMSDNNPHLSPSELARGRAANSERNDPTLQQHGERPLMLTPAQLRAGLQTNPDSEKLASGQEPSRKTLADPPSGYRRTASGGPVKGDFAPRVDQQQIDANPTNWLVRKFTGDDREDE